MPFIRTNELPPKEPLTGSVGRCRAIVVDYPVRDTVGGVDIR
jgi:hypothetical protein